MRKITYLLTMLFAASMMFMACKSEDPIRVVHVTGVSLNKSAFSLYVGASEQLVPIIAPDDADNTAVEWASSSLAIATVSNTGLVTAGTTEGTATITVTTVCGGFTASTTVTVKIPEVLVNGVTLDEADFGLIVGEYKQLTAIVTPDDADNPAVQWTSSDHTIATVSNTGVVTAVGAGIATITVRTVCGGHEAEVEVTVSIIPVTSITLDCGTTTLNLEMDQNQQFSVTVAPADATHQGFTWVSCTPAVASVSAIGLVNAVGTGTATITVTADCGDGAFYQEIFVTVLAVGQTEYGVVIDDVRWATRNVAAPGYFAAAAHSRGMFFQWNRRAGWFPDPENTDDNPPPIRYDGRPGAEVWENTFAGTETGYWYAENDPCPPGWRVPTRAEFQSLMSAGSTWEVNWNGTGVTGRLFGTYPYQVFLPLTGWLHSGTGLHLPAGPSRYWTNEREIGTSAFRLGFNVEGVLQHINERSPGANGYNVRCVAE